MSKKVQVLAVLALCGVMIGATTNVDAATISFRSGESAVTVLAGPTTTGFTSVFTAADFSDARTGPAAQIVPSDSLNSSWLKSENFFDTDAKWINVTGVGTLPSGQHDPSGLYAVKIDNKYGYTENVTLVLYYAVDNQLGWTSPQGIKTDAVYLNGESIIANLDTGFTEATGAGLFGRQLELRFSGLTLEKGENWIYLNAANATNGAGSGGVSGIIFSGSFDFTPVPEPVTMGLLGLGGLALLRRRTR